MAGFTGLQTLPLTAQEVTPSEEVVALPSLEVTGQKVATESSVGTRVNTSIIETPQSISVITRAELDARGVQRLTDAVAYTAGVQAEFQGIDSRVDTFKIRGYDAGGFTNSIYLDGLRAPGGGQWTRAQFETFGLESVEVLKGPAAILYGAVSPGGVVNSVSKRPSITHQDSVGVQYGSFNTIQGSFDVGGASRDSNVLYRVVGLARDGEAEVDHTDLQRLFIAPSLIWNITERTRLTLFTQFQKDDGGSTYQFLPQTGTLKPGTGGFYLDQSTFLGEPEWNLFERTQYALGYQLEHVVNDTFTARQNLRYSYVETEYLGMVGTPADANIGTGSYTRRAVRGVGDSKGLTIDTHLQAKFSTGAIEHTLLGGVDFISSEWTHLRLVNTAVPAINIYNPVYTPGIGNTLRNATNWQNGGDQDVTERQTGVYLQEQLTLGKLHGTLGVRHDWYDIDSVTVSGVNYNYEGTVGTPNTVSNIQERPESTTWRAGLLYLFDNGIAPYASYTTSFDSAPYTSQDMAGNPLTDPTEAEQIEVGIKYKPANFNALFTASAFQLTETNRLVRVQPTPARYAQIGEARIRGIELEGRVGLYKGLDLIASWTYLDSKITKSGPGNPAAAGNELPSTPNHIASLWLSYTFDSDLLAGLNIGSGVRHIGESFGDDANTIDIPDYTLFDASIGYDFGKKFTKLEGLSARLSASNIADKRYVASSTVAGASWYGSGRSLSLSLRYAW